MSEFKQISGVITLVQEQRFQLTENDGGHRLFILSHDAAQEWTDLQAWKETQQPVTVYYSEAHNLIAATAHDIWQQ